MQQPVESFWSPTFWPWRWLGPSSGFDLNQLSECSRYQNLSLLLGVFLICRVVAGTLCQYYYTAGYLLMALVDFHFCQTSFFSFLLLFSKTSLGCLPAQLQLAAAADRPHPPQSPLPLLLVGRPGIRQVADIKGGVLDCIVINVVTQRFPGSV